MAEKKMYSLLLILIVNYALGDEEFERHIVADKKGSYQIYWTVKGENITIELQVATKGYVGFGLTPNGGMPFSDMVIGWVMPNGAIHFQDRHALGFYEPAIDKEQNYQLLKAYENETHTVIRFTRKLETCDEDDRPITDDTLRIIYAWHPDDPTSTKGLEYHGQNRGTKKTYFFREPPPMIKVTDDIYVWDVRMPNVQIPAQETTYWCLHFKLPPLDEPHYYIGYSAHLKPGYEDIIHHFDVYECNGNATYFEEKTKNTHGYQCTNSEERSGPMECTPSLIIWDGGSEGQTLPKDVGVIMGEQHGGPSYFLIEIHYNNVQQRPGMVDNSLLRLYLTKKEVKYRQGVVQLYAEFDYSLVIPPKQPEFPITAYCSSECTAKAFPEEGVNIIAIGFHAHYTAKKMILRHFRGDKELKPISSDDHYNFNYQEILELTNPVKVLPGDVLVGVCVYSTMDRNYTTLGSSNTQEEMCFIFIYYYPATPLTFCVGQPSYQEIYNYFGVEEIGPDGIHILSPESLKNQLFFTHAKNYDWKTVDDAKLKQMYKMQFDGKKEIVCNGNPRISSEDTYDEIEFPSDATFYQAPQTCKIKNT